MQTTREVPPVPIPDSGPNGVRALYEKFAKSEAQLVGPHGRGERLPESLDAFLVQLIADVETGKSVSIIQSEATLTTAEAANRLGVSRQFLVRLLDSGTIPHHKVGTHRRVYLRDLLAYKAERDGRRRKTLDDLVEAESEEGLYDREPPADAEPR